MELYSLCRCVDIHLFGSVCIDYMRIKFQLLYWLQDEENVVRFSKWNRDYSVNYSMCDGFAVVLAMGTYSACFALHFIYFSLYMDEVTNHGHLLMITICNQKKK